MRKIRFIRKNRRSLGSHWEVIGRSLCGGQSIPFHKEKQEVIGRPLGSHRVEVSLTLQIMRVWHFVYINYRLVWSSSRTCTSTCTHICTHDPFTSPVGALRIIAPRALRGTSGCNSRRRFERSTDRQTDRQTNIQTDKQTHTHRQTTKQTYRLPVRAVSGQTDRQTDRQTDNSLPPTQSNKYRQTDRQTDNSLPLDVS